MYCPRCGYANRYDAQYCGSCSARIPIGEPRVTDAMRSPVGLAAVLSFFWCGLGQIYNGQIFKGVAMLVVYTISWVMIWLIIGIITTPILWIWGMFDAYRTAERLNRRANGGVA